MGPVHELSHTADVGFVVEAETLDELFTLAADGLIRAVGARPDPDAGAETSSLDLRRPALDRLLVAWLRELLLPILMEGIVPRVRTIEIGAPAPGDGPPDGGVEGGEAEGADEAGGDAPVWLEAEVEWRPTGPAGPEREIKGVTYHGLDVTRREGGWHARVVLDV